MIKEFSGNITVETSRSGNFVTERLVLIRLRPIKCLYQHQNSRFLLRIFQLISAKSRIYIIGIGLITNISTLEIKIG